MMLHTNYQGSRLCGFRHEVFFTFSIEAYVKHLTPRVETFLAQGL